MGCNIHVGFWKKVGIFKNSVYHYTCSITVTMHRCSLIFLHILQMYSKCAKGPLVSQERGRSLSFAGRLGLYVCACRQLAVEQTCGISAACQGHTDLYSVFLLHTVETLIVSPRWVPVSADRLLPNIITILIDPELSNIMLHMPIILCVLEIM